MATHESIRSNLAVGLGILTNLWVVYETGKAFARSESFTAILPQFIIFLAINGACFISSINPSDRK